MKQSFLWRIIKAAALIAGAFIVLAALWLFLGMLLYGLTGESYLADIVARLYYLTLATAAFLIGRWVCQRIRVPKNHT